jgi:hypothetical protein
MTLRFSALAGASVALAAVLSPSDAGACGGYFAPPETHATGVSGHRMAFAVSPTRTVLWDQIQYQGSPASFAWVLPVTGGAYLELSNDAWFETLDATTSAQVVSPYVACGSDDPTPPPSGGCCGSSAVFDGGGTGGGSGSGGPAVPPVSVLHEGTVGPYETVTLHANVPNALPAWLTSNGYAIDPSVSPIIDAYVSEGFDFIALRMAPGKGVQQMKPVRVITPGAGMTLPLRMVSAGTGAKVPIKLFVIGEGRYEAQNFPNGTVDPGKVTWSFVTGTSNYTTLRDQVLARDGGKTWNDAYAKQGALLSTLVGQVPGFFDQNIVYQVGSSSYDTIAEAYVRQGIADGAGTDTSCIANFSAYADSASLVVPPCAGQGGAGGGGGGVGGGADAGSPDAGTGGAGGAGGSGGMGGVGGSCMISADQIDGSTFACGSLDDVETALVGMHPSSVWITRLEANLPHAALANDLDLQAASKQTQIDNWFGAGYDGNPCVMLGATTALGGGGRAATRRARSDLALLVAAAGLMAAIARRRQRMGAARAT